MISSNVDEVALAERAARRGEHDPVDLRRRSAPHRLVDRAVLGVDGDDLGAALLRLAEDQLARHDERLLVGEREPLARANRRVGRPQPERADESRDDDVRPGVRGDLVQAFAPVTIRTAWPVGELRFQPRRLLRPGDRDELGLVRDDLGREPLDGAARREGDDAESVGERLDDVEGGSADGARRAEDGDAFHDEPRIIRGGAARTLTAAAPAATLRLVIDRDVVAAPGTPDRALLDEIDLSRLPRHIAVIMDGNGRWAKQRGSPRVEGHRAGIASVREVVETCARLKLDALTLYAFSVENWKRPRFEIVTLMSLLKEYLNRELANLLKNDIRFRVVGRMNELDASVQKELAKGLAATSSCRGMTFNIALNYGGRTEIVDACRSLAHDVEAGRLTPEQIDEETLGSRLGTAGLPDPDLLIRTSGEMRVSNFLLWQIAYSEIWVTPTLWPDFRKRHLFEAILDFQKRERRYGGVIDGGREPESGEAAG